MSYKYETMSEYDENDSVYSNNRHKVSNAMAELNDTDKLCFVRRTRASGGKLKKLLIFGSGDTGTTIRNAVTGEKYYGHKVGSKNEDLYFKARICTGEFGIETPTLFYDSVEQYEKHMGCTTEQSIKDKVAIRQRIARVSGDSDSRTRMNVVVR